MSVEQVYEIIEVHNEMVDKFHQLGKALTQTYSDVESTPVNDMFVAAYKSVIEMSIMLCCEANERDGCVWCTDENWHVIHKTDCE